MLNKVSPTLQQLYTQIQSLPQHSLSDLADYVEFLVFKSHAKAVLAQPTSALRLVHLRGILKGCDFSPALLAEARREMWKKFDITQ